MYVAHLKTSWTSIRNYKYRSSNERPSWFKDKFSGLKIGLGDFALSMHLSIDLCTFYIHVYKKEELNALLK